MKGLDDHEDGLNDAAFERALGGRKRAARSRKPAPVAKQKNEPVSPRLYTLTQRQARWLADARDTEGGAYVPITAGCEPYDLVEGGAASFREVRKSSGTQSASDSYLMPTEHGLGLLAAWRRVTP